MSRLLVPFLNKDPAYCCGVELGMQVLAPMLNGAEEVRGYFRTENEEQIRLCAHRLGYTVTELRPWRYGRKYTGWVWMVMEKRDERSSVQTRGAGNPDGL